MRAIPFRRVGLAALLLTCAGTAAVAAAQPGTLANGWESAGHGAITQATWTRIDR